MTNSDKSAIAYLVTVILALILFVAGLTLKLCGVLSLSWWVVTSPLWVTALGTLLVLGVLSLGLIIISAAARKR